MIKLMLVALDAARLSMYITVNYKLIDVGLGDWNMLSVALLTGNIELLRTLDDKAYKRVYTAISVALNLSFVDLRSVAKLTDVNPKSKNKPLLLKHIQAALNNLSVYRGSTTYTENTAT
ncbi:hypothetical protein GCG54_00003844 [Colletotrichum gloeosporioides]|uniref:Uncharacterized protein n=1 Tax=Colletotrichum gloeosporioides TaxID=474922 RepID=A0A8H4CE86_COLGL|nr:uncharacterized protein GCG54_00003844 [Colletotrichum gloeosporioides]KAF3802378.1 hypothetical protein GCG54_00003844 [Colletotrichum gloeosporioides]